MKFECIKNNIKEVVLQIEKITNKNLTLPILNSILFTTKNNSLFLRATNLDVGIEINIPVKILNQGSIAIPGSILSGFLSNLYNDNKITIEENNGNLNILSENSNINIKGFPVDDFPTLPTIKEDNSFYINLESFIKGIKSVIYSASLSDIKQELSSVYIYTQDNFIIFVSTDSFRLAEKKIPIKNINNFNGIIVPLKNALEIIRVFDDLKGDVLIKFNKNQISLTYNNIYFTSRIIDGIFPDYKQIIPKEYKTEVILLKQDFINSLKISNVFSDKFNKVLMDINVGDKKFKIKTSNSDIGESNINLDASLSGENLEISLNYKYIIDCFNSINQDSIVIQNNGVDKPIVIRGVGDNSFTYLVMSMNK